MEKRVFWGYKKTFKHKCIPLFKGWNLIYHLRQIKNKDFISGPHDVPQSFFKNKTIDVSYNQENFLIFWNF